MIAVLVGDVHRPGQDLGDPGRLADRLRLAGDLPRQAAAGQVLEREVGQAIVLADLENPHDVGVLDRGDRLGLGFEPGEVFRLALPPRRIIFKATNRSSRICRAL